MHNDCEEKAAGEPAERAARRTARWEEEQRVKVERPCNIQGVPMTLASGTQARASLPLTLEEKAPADSAGKEETGADRGFVDSVTGVRITLEDLMRAWA